MRSPAASPVHDSARIVRALLWKEWQEQRPVVAAGIGLTLAIPVLGFVFASAFAGPAYVEYQAQLVPFLFAALVWPLCAALSGASIHNERPAEADADFLLSRPVARLVLWGMKIGTGIAAVLIIVGCSYVVARIAWLLTAGETMHRYYLFAPIPYDDRVLGFAFESLLFGASLAAFSASCLLALFLRRPLAAALGGLLISSAVVSAAFSAASHLVADVYRPAGVDKLLENFFVVTAIGMLVAAYWMFRSDVRRYGQFGVGRGLAALVLALAISLLGGSAVAIDATTPNLSVTQGIRFVDTVPTSSRALLQVTHDGVAGSTFWTLGPERAIRRLTPGKTVYADILPDNRHIAYQTLHGPLGSRRDSCSLRIVRIDGSGDRLAREAIPCAGQRVFSPDASRVALFSASGQVTILALDGGAEPRNIDLRGTEAEGSSPHWWLDGGIVLEGRDKIHLLDVATGVAHNVFDDEGDYSIRRILSPEDPSVDRARGGRWFLVRKRSTANSAQLILIDSLNPSHQRSLPHCPGRERTSAFAQREARIFWADCGSGQESLSSLWVGDISEPRGDVWLTIHGRIDELRPSPSGARALVVTHVPLSAWSATSRDGYRFSLHRWMWYAAIPRIIVVDARGEVRDLNYTLGHRPPRIDDQWPPGGGPRLSNSAWRPVGWFDDDNLVLTRTRFDPGHRVKRNQFASLDVSVDATPSVLLSVAENR